MIVSIVNQQGHNFGDESAGCALVKELIKKDNVSKVNIFYASDSEIPVNNPKVKHNIDISLRNIGLKGIILFLMLPLKINKVYSKNKYLMTFIDEINKSDIIFVSPCGASIGIYRDWKFILRLLLVIKLKKKPIFHFNTVGQSGNYFFDILSNFILNNSTVYVREIESYNYLKSIGIKSKLGPDTAFLLPSIVSHDSTELAFVPAHLDDWHPFFKKNKIDKFIENQFTEAIANWCNRNNVPLKIIPHFNLQYEKDYCMKVYDRFIERGLSENLITVCNDIENYEEYDRELSKSRFVLGMRYHSIVLAAKNLVPFVALCYENKMIEVAEYMGQSEYCVNLVDKNRENLIDKTIDLLDSLLINEKEIISDLSNKYVTNHNKSKKITSEYCDEVNRFE